MSDDYDYLFKCICVGDGGCGKTALVVRFSQGFFQEQYKLTIGVEFAVKTLELTQSAGGKKVKLQIWDTGGQERFQYVRPLYYRGSMGAIILFDLSNRESFEHIPKWIEEVRANSSDIPMLLVGNKSDLVDERQVTRAEVEEFAKEFEMYYLESSAKNGTGVGDVFAIMSCLMIGIDIPSEYITDTKLTDKNGGIIGESTVPDPTPSEPEFVPLEDDPSLFEPSSDLNSIPAPSVSAPSIPEPQPVSAPSFFSDSNRVDTTIPAPAPKLEFTTPPEPEPEMFSNPKPGPMVFGDEDSSSSDNGPMVFGDEDSSSSDNGPMVFGDEDLSVPPISKEEIFVPIPEVVPVAEPELEEWSIPSIPTPSTPQNDEPSYTASSIPSEAEINASIPALPPRSNKITPAPQGPVTFDDFDDVPSTQTVVQNSAPPPLVFDTMDEPTSDPIPASNPMPTEMATPIAPIPKPMSTQQSNIGFVEQPNTSGFPNARPAAAPAGFKPKPQQSSPMFSGNNASSSKQSGSSSFSNLGFSDSSKSSKSSMNTLLGALGGTSSNHKSSTKSFQPFSSTPSGSKSTSSFFIPEVNVENNSPTQFESFTPPVPKKVQLMSIPQEDSKKKKKKDKKDKKKKKKKKNIIICPSCGAMLSSKYKFCNKCGSPI